ncbi:spore cortex-lytic enzyme [Alkaliphilus serpentinus]|uniref:Spore cortex-lytic enzyme n=1 Tax=Alkaliphilus serpentinus TaxID=1482731 RepID=A0A833HN88_9FIRM|nr:spore cortex-lytic enzyme [Alkaliphilus serpentinus]KAB3529277.1 spore cortex-lytic enzyme [Alkaliphilus serpentinus]
MKRKGFTVAIIILVFFISISMVFNGIKAQNLAWGSRGNEVRELQTRLQRWGYYDGPISSIYGQQTYEAVIAFQRANGLSPDGVVGPQTRAALGMARQTPAPTTPTGGGVSRSDDINLLARTIHAEAKGEPYEGKVAVGAVILNRIRNAAFPNTMAGVVYQPCAFEPTKNGAINQAPNDEAFRAARDALNGWDPTGGAIYFWNPATATSRWIWTRKITLRIGKHVFAH